MNTLSKDIISIIEWYLWKRNIFFVNKEYHNTYEWNHKGMVLITTTNKSTLFPFNYRLIARYPDHYRYIHNKNVDVNSNPKIFLPKNYSKNKTLY